MKTAKFTLNNKELLLVELPNIEGCDPFLFNADWLIANGVFSKLPFHVNLIGKLPEVTEDQYHELVHFFIYEDERTKENVYRDYSELGFHDTAKESFFSALTANGILFRNPLGSHPDNWTYKTEAMHMKNTDISAWQSAQDKVFNIDNTYLFEKVLPIEVSKDPIIKSYPTTKGGGV